MKPEISYVDTEVAALNYPIHWQKTVFPNGIIIYDGLIVDSFTLLPGNQQWDNFITLPERYSVFINFLTQNTYTGDTGIEAQLCAANGQDKLSLQYRNPYSENRTVAINLAVTLVTYRALDVT